MTELSHLLESYGGHELAAGFTIHRDRIGDFREEICRLAEEYCCPDDVKTVLEADCVIPPELLTVHNIESLDALEPCGNGCPKPVLVMEHLTVDKITPVGGGRHLRLRLSGGYHSFNGIFFSTTAESASVEAGDAVDVAFVPQINDYWGERTVQMNIQDIRPACKAPVDCDTENYQLLRAGKLSREVAEKLLPDRATLGIVWRYLAQQGSEVREMPICLCRKIVRISGVALSLEQMLTCLNIFADVGLLELQRQHKYITIRLIPTSQKADLNESRTMQSLLTAKEQG